VAAASGPPVHPDRRAGLQAQGYDGGGPVLNRYNSVALRIAAETESTLNKSHWDLKASCLRCVMLIQSELRAGAMDRRGSNTAAHVYCAVSQPLKPASCDVSRDDVRGSVSRGYDVIEATISLLR